jgi:enamidase
MRRLVPLILALGFAVPWSVRAQIAPVSSSDAALAYAQSVIAFKHAKVVDGTGMPAQEDRTVIIKDGRIALVGPASTPIPPGATLIDATGKALLPGFVMMHEHLFYPTGDDSYTEMLTSFPRLYLAGGTTTLRTGGAMSPYADLRLRARIASGATLGPDLEVTGPYLDGADSPILKMHALSGPDDAQRTVNYWADQGVTSFKGYTQLTRAELRAIITTAHSRGLKVTAHLCSITYREAAQLGIDNLEHGFGAATDFVPDKRPDHCPDSDQTFAALAALDLDSPAVKDLIALLVARHVALTSTLPVFETLVPGRPEASERARSVLIPQLRKQYETTWARIHTQVNSPWPAAFAKLMRLEKMFVAAGGILMAGTDPTGYGGVIPGFAAKREIELLVEAGLPFEQALRIATLNGAIFLGRAREVGSIEVGKRADLVLIDADPMLDTQALERMPLVFKAGKGYRTDLIIDQLQAVVGLY